MLPNRPSRLWMVIDIAWITALAVLIVMRPPNRGPWEIATVMGIAALLVGAMIVVLVRLNK